MNIYNKKQLWKLALFIFAAGIGIASLYYTDKLVKLLADEEKKRVELWAEATKRLVTADPSEADLSFMLQVIQNNKTIPVILVDIKDEIITYRNLDSLKALDTLYLKNQLGIMKKLHTPIMIKLVNGNRNFIYYKDSIILTKLTYYPYIQLGLILLFIMIAYFAFSNSRRAEQNQVWLGLSKETAHQLGTPASSLMAWVEIMKEKNIDAELTEEIDKDAKRLELITSRFSNIGSKPVLKETSLSVVVNNALEYLKSRVSDKVQFFITIPSDIILPLNYSLFEWVIENVFKNAIDAIEGEGIISITAKEINNNKINIDISDTGKGIPKRLQKTIFQPGFTTKSRGWGLGLSLTKRIVEIYHGGKIFVLFSEPDKGTTIRISLNK